MSNHQTYLINGNANSWISPLDRGLSYGDGVFRTFKMVNGVAIDWPLHYQKLVADCVAIGIVCPSPELLMADLMDLFTINESAVAKVIITRGEGERGYAPPAVTTPTRIVIKSPLPSYPEANFNHGVALFLCRTPLAIQPALAGVKHLNRLENVLARAEWRDPKYAEGLMMDVEGHVIECTSANLFARFGQELCTPDLSRCGIAGVTRQKILNLTPYLGLKNQLRPMTLAELLEADEVIICNSLYGAWQVNAIEDKQFPTDSLAEKIRALLTE